MASRRQSGRSSARAFFLFLPALFGVVAVAGCDDTYDVEIVYPLRRDWIVNVESLEYTPPQFNPPGLFPLDFLEGRDGLKPFGPDLSKAKEKSQVIDPKTLTDRLMAVGFTDVEIENADYEIRFHALKPLTS